MKTKFNELLEDLRACEPATEWALHKTWKEVFETCHRGDWLLWLFEKTNPEKVSELTLAKGYCVNTVRHLMKDDRSTAAIDGAIAFGEGRISLKELNDLSKKAADAADDAAYYAADAADAAAAAAYYAADAAYYADDAAYYAAYYAADAAAADAEINNQRLTAEICRKYLPIEIWGLDEY